MRINLVLASLIGAAVLIALMVYDISIVPSQGKAEVSFSQLVTADATREALEYKARFEAHRPGN
jgi:hypothetical protein